MFRWIKKYKEADAHTKYFIINWLLYSVLIVATTIYVYARLDYVRSTRPEVSPKIFQTNVQK